MEKKEKVIQSDDGSFLKIEIFQDGRMSFILQAKHLGDEVKFTSISIELTQEETLDVINWAGEELMRGLSE